jgi:predicted GIY-YIG superfamily endonuclease
MRAGWPTAAHGLHRASLTILYRLFAADGSLLYVGITGKVHDRFYRHSLDKSWWPEVERRTVRCYPSLGEAAAAEEAVIAARRPRYNKYETSGLAGEPVPPDIVGAYAMERGISRSAAVTLILQDPEARRHAIAARQRAKQAISERFAKVRREAPLDEGEPYHDGWRPPPAWIVAMGLRVSG